MFWALAALAKQQGRFPWAERCSWATAGAAVVLWLVLVLAQMRTRTVRGKDAVVITVSFVVLAAGLGRGAEGSVFSVAASTLLLMWNARGVFRAAIKV